MSEKIKWRGLKSYIANAFMGDPKRWAAGFGADEMVRYLEEKYPEKGPLGKTAVPTTLRSMLGPTLARSNHYYHPTYWFKSPGPSASDEQPPKTGSRKIEPPPPASSELSPILAIEDIDAVPALLAIVGRGDEEISVLVRDSNVILTFGKHKTAISIWQYKNLRAVLGLLN